MRVRTLDRATGHWFAILTALGIDKKYLQDVHGPCPLCGGKDRFRWDDRQGRGTYYCSHCGGDGNGGAGSGYQLALRWSGLTDKDLLAKIDTILGDTPAAPPREMADDKRRQARTLQRLRRIGEALVSVTPGDPVYRYLTQTRGIDPSVIPVEFLRLHPALEYWEKDTNGRFQRLGSYPAMVAALRQPSGAIESFHATYLTPDGCKADVPSARKVLGKLRGLQGCAMRLTSVHEHIGITEGIENALAGMELYGHPVWPCYSSEAVANFVPPQGVRTVTVYSEGDSNFVAQEASARAARRLAREGYAVNLPKYPPLGMDLNDLLQEKNAQRDARAD